MQPRHWVLQVPPAMQQSTQACSTFSYRCGHKHVTTPSGAGCSTGCRPGQLGPPPPTPPPTPHAAPPGHSPYRYSSKRRTSPLLPKQISVRWS